uniref:Capsid protein n=1 Tax=Apple picorna-like virus 1 TaxID=2709736 RepID=A0A6C0X1A4_9VIRU|nr:MAG: capsid protein [Apple picorna-like virus 1]
MNSEPEIIENNPESKLAQPKSASGQLPFLKSIPLISTIYKWMPTGVRVIINLPVLSDDKSFLFLIRYGPYICHYTEACMIYGVPLPLMLQKYFSLVYYDRTGNMGTPLTDNDPVRVTQYGLPPLLSMLMYSYRRWRGDMEYRIRVASNFGNQGIIGTTPVYNVIPLCTKNDSPFIRPNVIVRRDEGYLSNFANSYQYQDASMFRHAEVRMKYQKPTEWVDHFAVLSNLLGSAQNPAVNLSLGIPTNSVPTNDDFVGVFLKGTLPGNSNTNQIEMEIDYRACENFELAGESIFPNTTNEFFVNRQNVNLVYTSPARSTIASEVQAFGNRYTWPNLQTTVTNNCVTWTPTLNVTSL